MTSLSSLSKRTADTASPDAEGDELLRLEAELAGYRRWIGQIADVCERAARGDLEGRVLHCSASGDLARLIHAVNHAFDITDAFVREAGAALDGAANGKFFRRVLLRGMPGSFRQASRLINNATGKMALQATALRNAEERREQLVVDLETAVQGAVATVASASTEVRATAASLAATSQRTNDEADAVASVSNDIATTVGTVATSADRLTTALDSVSAQSEQSSRIAGEAVAGAARTNVLMNELSEASQRVEGVVKLISQIARQTNLLALNATIEAARSGEAGKGFAVVASEVKSLARQTGSATEQITADVDAILGAAQNAEGGLSSIAATIDSMNQVSASIAEAMIEQRAAAETIRHDVRSMVEGTSTVSQSIVSLAEASREATSNAADLLAAADELSRLSESLRATVDGFIHGMRNEGKRGGPGSAKN